MRPSKIANYLLTISVLYVSACTQQEGRSKSMIIATSANMQFATQELTRQFTEKTGTACELVIGSSGKLTAQIMEGAPYDIFLSANMRYPNEIFKNGLAVDSPKIYAYGKLVLWSMIDGIEPSVAQLSGESVKHIALANPKIAPYGIAAREALQHYDLLPGIEDKLVYGESIAQTNQFITSRSAELGFTAMSVVLSPQMKGKGRWIEVDESIYTPIEQGVVIIRRKNFDDGDAKKFVEFLFSREGKEILQDFGYLASNQPK